MIKVPVADIRAVYDEHYRVAARIVTLPQFPQRVLPTHIPQLEIHVLQGNGRDVLSDGGHRLELRFGGIR